jgi:hypothetical protein
MLIAALSQEAHDAQEVADHGRRALAGSDKGIEMREIEAGHPLLIERARKAKERLTWCRERVKLLPRPLQFLGGRADAQRGRDLIGHDSWDSVEIAIDRDAPLWTDDLGLRCIDVSGQRAQATSTVSLLASLREAGKLHESDLHKHLHTLIVQRYRAILPTRELLVSGILRYPELGRSGLSELLSTLCGLPTIGGATDLFSETLRAVVMASVEVLSLEDLTNFGLEAMSHRWPRVLVAQQLHNSIQAKLALLPLPLRAIQRTCTDFARRPGSSPA